MTPEEWVPQTSPPFLSRPLGAAHPTATRGQQGRSVPRRLLWPRPPASWPRLLNPSHQLISELAALVIFSGISPFSGQFLLA